MTQRRVLIAEDDLDVLALETKILEKAGYEVDSVTDGEAALAAIEQTLYCVVVLDVMMPKLDGFTLTKEIRKRFGKRIPVLLVTAVQDPMSRAHEQEAKPIAVIEKPFLARSLAAAVEMLEAQGQAARRPRKKNPKSSEPKSWLQRLFGGD